MRLRANVSNRACTVHHDPRPTPAKLRERILAEDGVQGGFSVLTAKAPAYDDTLFAIAGNDKGMLLAVALFDSQRTLSGKGDKPLNDTVEVLIDPKADGIGYHQFIFGPPLKLGYSKADPHRDPDPTGELQTFTHTPYPEAHSSAYRGVRLKKYQWKEETLTDYSIAGRRVRWLFAWFSTAACAASTSAAIGRT
jgi:hypothetical protein